MRCPGTNEQRVTAQHRPIHKPNRLYLRVRSVKRRYRLIDHLNSMAREPVALRRGRLPSVRAQLQVVRPVAQHHHLMERRFVRAIHNNGFASHFEAIAVGAVKHTPAP